MSRLAVVTGDTPIIALDLTDQESGLVVDLSNAATTIAFKVRVVGSTTLKATVACTKLVGRKTPGGAIDSGAPYNVVGFGGRCQAECPSTVFDAPGEYEAEVEVTFGASARIATVFQLVRIQARAQF